MDFLQKRKEKVTKAEVKVCITRKSSFESSDNLLKLLTIGMPRPLDETSAHVKSQLEYWEAFL